MKHTLVIPKWAISRITELSRKSGVSANQIMEDALNVGLYSVRDEYSHLIKFRESAHQLWNLEEETNEIEPSNKPDIQEPETTRAMDVHDRPDESSGQESNGTGHDLFDVERGHESQDNPDTEPLKVYPGSVITFAG